MTDVQSRPPRLLQIDPGQGDIASAVSTASSLGFTHILAPLGPDDAKLNAIADAAEKAGLGLWIDVSERGHATAAPQGGSGPDVHAGPLNPHRFQAGLTQRNGYDREGRIAAWAAGRADGAVIHSAALARRLQQQVAQQGGRFAIATVLPDDPISTDLPAGSDYGVVTLPANGELSEALDDLTPAGGPLLFALQEADHGADANFTRRLQLAAALGTGVIVPARLLGADGAGSGREDAIRETNHLLDAEPALAKSSQSQRLSGAGETMWAALRVDGHDARTATNGLLALANRDEGRTHEIPNTVWARMTAGYSTLSNLSGSASVEAPLAPGEVRLVSLGRADAPRSPRPGVSARAAAAEPRVILGGVSPSVDEGRYSIKRVVGDILVVEADIFGDGHDHLAAELVLKAEDEVTPIRVRMEALPNDRWQAEIPLTRMGRCTFWIEAWYDVWASYHHELEAKWKAAVPVTLEIREGMSHIEATRNATVGKPARVLGDFSGRLSSMDGAAAVELLLSDDLAEAMHEADRRPFLTKSFAQNVEVERLQARFASWYELFPRSTSGDPAKHGTLRDVIGRLPAIRDMGFDVLYFTPIHPIGLSNRKGRNNSVTAQPGEPGSPYAIGSAAGGHEAIHPDLGTLKDFQALRLAAQEHGLELALDFAIQCSPDHPWLKEHPGWFAWRPDGSIKYAENPPKKYQDIVNVDFYASGAVPDLWMALRHVVLFWVDQGVKIFRVDNPHTKPLAFWQWMINDVRGQHPDVMFLSEAFTRPKVMYHLAKVGFSQSYTYFTWRNSKYELTEYLTELNVTGVRDYFRPHFFVNTPDINPHFLQTSGRGGFLIRAALATTLSGLWGMYSGFELCESEPIPGKEEYKDSEKFEIRTRDWAAAGNIIAEITKLNAIRKTEPALQTHLGLSFYNAFNDNILWFGKAAPGERGKVMVAISLDPHHAQDANFEIPLWEWGLPDHGEANVIDLVNGQRLTWHGKTQHIRLTPDAPYAIWKVGPKETA